MEKLHRQVHQEISDNNLILIPNNRSGMTKSIKTTKIEHEKNLNLRKYKNALASLFKESENN